MGCCPPAPPKLSATDSPPSAKYGGDTAILNGESAECYAKNATNPTGLQDDATGNALDKIENTTVATDCQAKTDTTFRLTHGSTKTPTTWTMEVLQPEGQQLTGVTFSPNGQTAKLTGTFSDNLHGKTIKISITAKDSGDIDTRTFVFSPAKCSGSDSIQLISPLPGAIINSKFGPRMHPIQKIMKPHTGIDMKYADRSVKDVVAACDGEVTYAGNTGGGYGIAVKIKHINSTGKHLCTTTYNHLNKVYVTPGQKVAAGQKVGLEGTTGASTGNHLHFELRLPNNAPIDPEPYMRGEIQSARATTPSNDPDPSAPIETKNENNRLTPSNVDAKVNGCEPFGPGYTPKPDVTPSDPPTELANDPPPIASDDPFELAWFYTMKREVNSQWSTSAKTSPTDPDVAAGKIETADQKRRVGYNNDKADKGGETKFGVAQSMNRKINVATMDYNTAKTLGYNKYWKANCPDKPKYIAIFMFDLTYLCGAGGARTILSNAGISSSLLSNKSAPKSEQLAACAQLRDAQIKYHQSKVVADPSQRKFLNGWTNRANATYSYVASLP